MPALHRVLNMPKYVLIIPGYTWLCLYVLKPVWMTFVLYLQIVLPIVIPDLKEL